MAFPKPTPMPKAKAKARRVAPTITRRTLDPVPPKPKAKTPAPKPKAPAPKAAAPPKPKPVDFTSWLQGAPEWQQMAPQWAAQEGQLYSQYGFHPDATGHLVADTAAENPFGGSAQAAQALGTASQAAQNNANSRGLLYSGVNALGQQQAQTGYQHSLHDLLQSLQGGLQGIAGQRATELGTLQGQYYAQLPPAGTPAAAAPAAVAKPPGAPKPPAAPKPPGLKKPKTAMLPRPRVPAPKTIKLSTPIRGSKARAY